MRYGPDGDLLAAGTKTGSVCLFRLPGTARKPFAELKGHRGPVASLDFGVLPDGAAVLRSRDDRGEARAGV